MEAARVSGELRGWAYFGRRSTVVWAWKGSLKLEDMQLATAPDGLGHGLGLSDVWLEVG